MSNSNEIITGPFTLPYYDDYKGKVVMQTPKTRFVEYRLMVLDLRKKEKPDHNRIIFSIDGTMEIESSADLKEAVMLKHLSDLSKIENIQDMKIDVMNVNYWYL